MKGILIEKGKRKAIVMDKKGRFMQTKTSAQWMEGSEVEFESPSVAVAKKLSVAAIFLMVLAIGVFSIYMANSYTVTLDVNPSIEIKTSAFNNVTEVLALNDDASSIEGLENVIGMKIGPAINSLISDLKQTDYLQEYGTVVLSVEGKNGKVRTIIRKLNESIPDAYIEDDDEKTEDPDDTESIDIYVTKLTNEMKEKAEELEVPVGRLVLAEKAINEGATVSYEMVKVLSIQEIQDIRNVSKTINKVSEIIERSAGKEEDSGKNLTQIEALSDKIEKQASRIESNMNELQENIQSGNADENDIYHHGVLDGQLGQIIGRIEEVEKNVESKTNQILNEMKEQNKDSSDEDKVKPDKEEKKEEQEEKKDEVKSRIEEKLDEVRAKVEILKTVKGKSEEAKPAQSTENPGQSTESPGQGTNNHSEKANQGKGNS